jgi:TusA-related sulfurtransferase
MTDRPHHYLDITGEVCPITFVKTKLLIEKANPGDLIEIRLAEGEPLENLPRSVREEGHAVSDPVFEGRDGAGRSLYRLRIRKA